MKNPILLSIIVPVMLIGAAAIFSNKTYRVERIISATPEAVWAVLMDTAAYGEWNPVFVKVEGSYAAGGTVLNTFKDPSGKLFDVTNKVEALEPNRLLRQKGGMLDHRPVADIYEIINGLFLLQALDGHEPKMMLAQPRTNVHATMEYEKFLIDTPAFMIWFSRKCTKLDFFERIS